MKKYLVTGGAGFIGSHLVRSLLLAGHKVIVIDDLSTGKRSNISNPDTDLLVGSILDLGLLGEAAQGCDGIFHLAAMVSVQDSIDKWQEGHDVNLIGTIKVFQAALAVGSIPVVYASSAAVYGNQNSALCSESEAFTQPVSPYGADKLACEHQARAFAKIHGIASFGLRFFNVYGPGQQDNSPYSGVISRFVRNAVDGIPHTIFGDGQQTRDFIYVSDVVAGLQAAMIHLNNRNQNYVSNICTGGSCSLLNLIDVLNSLRPGTAHNLDFQPSRSGDVKHSCGCNKMMFDMLRVTPRTSLRDGLADVLAASSRLH